MMNETLKKQIELLPDQPGCYLMHNADDEIIYIGKAKNLKKRVSQYFLRVHSGKTAAMVSHVDHFETIITKSEKEALILEMNLIQKNHPRYNILLMDDKHYPYIAIHKNVENPYVGLSRNVKDKKCEYFGPYPNSSAAFEVIDLINKLFPLRKCHNVPKSPCLYYHIGQCLAPCVNKVSRDEYDKIIDNIRNFLKGKNQELTKNLKEKIKKCSDELQFERAQEFKKMLDSINHITEKQTVEFKDKINRDFFSFHTRENYIAIALFSYREGILLSKRAFCYELIGDINEFVSEMIYQYYGINSIPNEIIVSSEEIKDNLNSYFENANVFSPTKGKLHDVLDICEINAKEALEAHAIHNAQPATSADSGNSNSSSNSSLVALPVGPNDLYMDLSFSAFLKKSQDGILPDMQNFFYERNILNRGYLATLSCEFRGTQAQASMIRYQFETFSPLCDRILKSYSFTFKAPASK